MNKINKNIKHGMKGTRFYSIWGGMKTRCYNKKHGWFKHYGGRGIVTTEEWKKFENFMKDMYPSYIEHLKKYTEIDTTLDRIDCNKIYSKENCRWATKKEQSNNARNNVKITFNGKTQSILKWSLETGISYFLIWQRNSAGMPPEIIFTKKNLRSGPIKYEEKLKRLCQNKKNTALLK